MGSGRSDRAQGQKQPDGHGILYHRFVGTTIDKRFHEKDCALGNILRGFGLKTFRNAKDALKAGYEPCGCVAEDAVPRQTAPWTPPAQDTKAYPFWTGHGDAFYHKDRDCRLLRLFCNVQSGEELRPIGVESEYAAGPDGLSLLKPCPRCILHEIEIGDDDSFRKTGTAKPEGESLPPTDVSLKDFEVVWKWAPAASHEATEIHRSRLSKAAKNRHTSTLTFNVGACPGEGILSAELWGRQSRIQLLIPQMSLSCPETADCSETIEAIVTVTASARDIWTPEALHAWLVTKGASKDRKGRGIAVPEGASCTPDVDWQSLLKGQTQTPSIGVLRNLLMIASLLQAYKNTLLDGEAVTVLAGWKAPSDKGRAGSGTLAALHAEGLALDFKVRGRSYRDVGALLDPYHPGGLGFRKGQVQIDLRGSIARYDTDGRLDRLHPADCRSVATVTDEQLIEAFGKVLKTRRIPKGKLPPTCSCRMREGRPERGEPDRVIAAESCRCLRPVPADTDPDLRAASTRTVIQVQERKTRSVVHTFHMELRRSLMLIQPAVGEGAHNLKEYAFHGAFLNSASVPESAKLRKLGEPGFAEHWVVRIPVTVTIAGDFLVRPASAFEADDRGLTTLVLAPFGHGSAVIDKVEISAVPPSFGASACTRKTNTAGDGEAYGQHKTDRFAFKGCEIVYNEETDPQRFHGPGLVQVHYVYDCWSKVGDDPEWHGTTSVDFTLLIRADRYGALDPTEAIEPAQVANASVWNLDPDSRKFLPVGDAVQKRR
ncbi:hypothetical protein [Polymorphum gilvum]|uniref:Uncharacterized protein n=1 Tax=Polymorphum gilvum (strain LMG 25793 / CGMCC 1.9160 / SL003B-26A1) TaxID=991905 RepID=F2IVU9_POLGS|nr:hypothetical protein [Polymorphum gilvum]ADZ69206.1 hypothetical protein SL003B_0776 [Polymorphum gilvum SL003B-26A1]